MILLFRSKFAFQRMSTKLDEFLCGVFPGAIVSVSITTTCGGRSIDRQKLTLVREIIKVLKTILRSIKLRNITNVRISIFTFRNPTQGNK